MMTHNSHEIERKFLIRRPNEREIFEIKSRAIVAECKIVQTYLTSTDGTERRVRKRTSSLGTTEYFYTEKRKITEEDRIEDERRIGSMQEVEKLLAEADKTRKPLEKTRYVISYKGNTFEMDIYNFSEEYAILELEIPYSGFRFELPSFLEKIEDVTDDSRYKNSSLAKTQSFPFPN